MKPSKVIASRRRFLQSAAASVSSVAVGPFILKGQGSPNQKLQHASFGANGMAGGDLRAIARHPDVELVAVADVDLARAKPVIMEFPEVRVYQDYRELLEKEGDKIDCCNVSTPDHMHAAITMSAMNKGKHCYTQKPLTHDVYESRRLKKIASEKGLMTQMGTQLASSTPDMTIEKWVQAGVAGKIKEVHTFSHKTWGDPNPIPKDRKDEVPATLNWDVWNGIVDPVTYIHRFYHPGIWRKRIPFGTGTLGDMGCHMFNGWFRALSLTAPQSIRSVGPAPGDNWAIDGEIHYTFPGNQFTSGKTIEVTWYDGARRPPAEIVALMGEKFPKQGSVYVGEEGVLVHPHGGTIQFFKNGKSADAGQEMVKGSSADHWKEFVDSILDRTDGKKPKSNFDFAGPMSETVLLGNVASFYPGEELAWNAESMTFPDKPDASQYVRRAPRDGWKIKGLE